MKRFDRFLFAGFWAGVVFACITALSLWVAFWINLAARDGNVAGALSIGVGAPAAALVFFYLCRER